MPLVRYFISCTEKTQSSDKTSKIDEEKKWTNTEYFSTEYKIRFSHCKSKSKKGKAKKKKQTNKKTSPLTK